MKTYLVGNERVRVRSRPGLKGAMIKWLTPRQSIEVDETSRTEADGYVWWKHADGWSAAGSIDGQNVFMSAIPDAKASPVSDTLDKADAPVRRSVAQIADQPGNASIESKAASRPAQATAPQRVFAVGSERVRVRSQPGLAGPSVGWLPAGQTVEADPGSRTEADGYVWWKHAAGWSAERSVDGSQVFLDPPGQAPQKLEERKASEPAPSGTDSLSGSLPNVNRLPFRDGLFKRLPVDLEQITFWQYYGNNVFSHDLWRDGKQWYAFSQGLHAGLDFGNASTRGVPVYAGLEGTFDEHNTSFYRPNALRVKVGDYTVIYGHLANPRSFQFGQPVGVDTVMGELEFGGQAHLHLEVRYQERWIINPLLLMPPDMRNALIEKFPPGQKYFFKSARWAQWQTPLDQPVLVLGGGLIGPNA